MCGGVLVSDLYGSEWFIFTKKNKKKTKQQQKSSVEGLQLVSEKIILWL